MAEITKPAGLPKRASVGKRRKNASKPERSESNIAPSLESLAHFLWLCDPIECSLGRRIRIGENA